MSGVLTTTPARTQAAIIRAVLAQKYPKLALPTIAANFKLQLVDLQAILNHHGYPETVRLHAAAAALEAGATAPARPVTDQADDEEPVDGYLIRVPLEQLHADPDNVREHLDDIDDLAASIQEAGLLQPIVARKHQGRLIVVAGHRRLAAVRTLRWPDVPVIVRADIKPDDVLAAMLIENGQRKDLDPIEEARGLARLKAQLDLTDGELAKKIGRSQPTVSARLALLSLTAAEQAEIRAGQMTLIEGTHKGRLASGRVGKTGVDRNWHLGPTHGLADRAKARCNRLAHPKGRKVGGMACGACWESVIRADEREHAQALSGELGKCVTCDTPVEKTA